MIKEPPLEIGAEFGWLTVLSMTGNWHGWNAMCLCRCGNMTLIQAAKLKGTQNRKRNSCQMEGCGYVRGIDRTMSKNKLYERWSGMKARCSYRNHASYPHYGARGIRVCDRWRDSFEDFVSDMGAPPSDEYSLDRIDNDGNYTPENCRWATRQEQRRNSSTNKYLTFEGEARIVCEWVDLLGIPSHIFYSRIYNGMTDDQIFLKPIRRGEFAKRSPASVLQQIRGIA